MENISLEEIIKNTDSKILKRWILQYAKNHASFEESFRQNFSPQQISEEQMKDYAAAIYAAFRTNPFQTGNRYGDWDVYGFDADGVRADLEKLLDEADYYLKYNNTKIPVQICKNMIEIIPEEWEDQFDYEGDVQVMYDGAIDRLEEMLKANIFSSEEKQELFEWYKEESQEHKHEDVGLNTDLNVLQDYFMDSKEMLEQNLNLLDQKINLAQSSYEKERLIIQKIAILKDTGMTEEMKNMIAGNLNFVKVRKIKLDAILQEKDYEQAVELIEQGIVVAEKLSHRGTVSDWKDELLKIYLLQNDNPKVLSLAEDLLFHGREERKYYQILKAQTPKDEWMDTVNRIIQKMKSGSGIFGFNHLRAQILIEHEKWEQLFEQCKKGGVQYVEEYEKQLKSLFEKEIFQIYLNYIEQEATITDQKSYENVGRVLKCLKTLKGGKEKVQELISNYRVVYKRRKNMIAVLDQV